MFIAISHPSNSHSGGVPCLAPVFCTLRRKTRITCRSNTWHSDGVRDFLISLGYKHAAPPERRYDFGKSLFSLNSELARLVIYLICKLQLKVLVGTRERTLKVWTSLTVIARR